MAAAGHTHSQLAVMLVDGSLAHIAGNVRGSMPFAPVPAPVEAVLTPLRGETAGAFFLALAAF